MATFESIMLGLSVLEKLTNLVVGMINKAKQNAELTPEQAAEVDAKQKSTMAQAHWVIDPDPE